MCDDYEDDVRWKAMWRALLEAERNRESETDEALLPTPPIVPERPAAHARRALLR